MDEDIPMTDRTEKVREQQQQRSRDLEETLLAEDNTIPPVQIQVQADVHATEGTLDDSTESSSGQIFSDDMRDQAIKEFYDEIEQQNPEMLVSRNVPDKDRFIYEKEIHGKREINVLKFKYGNELVRLTAIKKGKGQEVGRALSYKGFKANFTQSTRNT